MPLKKFQRGFINIKFSASERRKIGLDVTYAGIAIREGAAVKALGFNYQQPPTRVAHANRRERGPSL